MSKVLVFCIDALCASDIADMRPMPHFGRFMEKSALVEQIEPVWPALTYCCHTSIITGCYDKTREILSSHIDKLHAVAQYLFQNEKLDGEQFKALMEGREVPEVLLSGHHANIAKWRREQSLLRTMRQRPDLLEKADLTEKERLWVMRHKLKEETGRVDSYDPEMAHTDKNDEN